MAISYVTKYGATANNTTTPKTVSPVVVNGDCLIVGAFVEDSALNLGTPSDGNLTYTARASNSGAATAAWAAELWSAFASSSLSLTLSESLSGTARKWAFAALKFTGVASTGATASVTNSAISAATTTLTTTADHSAIVMIITDSSGGNPTLTYSTATAGAFTEVVNIQDSGLASYWMGYYADAGLIGTKTIGATNTSLDRVIIAVELVPTTGVSASWTDADVTGTAQNLTHEVAYTYTAATATGMAQDSGGSVDTAITGAAATGASQPLSANYDYSVTLIEATGALSALGAGGSSDSELPTATAVVAGQDFTLIYDAAPTLTEAAGAGTAPNAPGWSESSLAEAQGSAAATQLDAIHDDAGTPSTASASGTASDLATGVDAAWNPSTATSAANDLGASSDATWIPASATGEAIDIAAVPPLTEASATGSALDLTANYDGAVQLVSATVSAAATNLDGNADVSLASAAASATAGDLTASSISELTTATGALVAPELANWVETSVYTALAVGEAFGVSEPVSVMAMLTEAVASAIAADLSYVAQRPWPPRADVHLRYDVEPAANTMTNSAAMEPGLVVGAISELDLLTS